MADLSDDDLSLPKGWQCEAREGWFISGSDGRSAEFFSAEPVKVGRAYIPERFQLNVVTPESACTLLFSASAESMEVRLNSIISVDEDVDEALARIKAARPVNWWKTKARVELQFDSNDRDYSFLAENGHGSLEELISIGAEAVHNIRQSESATRRRDRVTNVLLESVAGVYRRSWSEGGNPTSDVAQDFKKSHSTAARWVGLARKRGFLGPADGSRGGELND